MALDSGARLGPYEIVAWLGAGGMGEVYEAADTRPNRRVALKILPAALVADPERRRRFIQEAQLASALQHPNIVTIFDIGSANGTEYLAMELVRGRTLDVAIRGKGLRLADALRYGVQITDALAAAHAAGIVHRDLKPTNIMVSDQGQIKILDFGLATLVDRGLVTEGEETRLRDRVETGVGTILGTVAYMSPEQAEGRKVDARSDIFSFGAILYEMLSGQRAFQGDSTPATLAAVINLEPRPLSKLTAGMPVEVERLVSRCLHKDLGRRAQHASDVKVALEELREDSSSGALAVAAAPRSARLRGRAWAAGALVVVGLLAVAVWAWWPRAAPTPVAFEATPLTALPGSEDNPSFSPDARQIVFQSSPEGDRIRSDVYVQLVTGTGTRLRLGSDGAAHGFPAWSPDGRFIAMWHATPTPGEIPSELMLISPLGGPERSLLSLNQAFWNGQPHPIAWSPDGRWLAVSQANTRQNLADGIVLLSPDTGERVDWVKLDRVFSGSADPSFSPDGSRLAYIRTTGEFTGQVNTVAVGRDGRPVGAPTAVAYTGQSLHSPIWTADGRSLLAIEGDPSSNGGITRIPLDAPARAERLVGLQHAKSLALSRDGTKLAFSRGGNDSDIWRFDLRDPSKSGRFAASTLWDGDPAYSPDGRRVAFASNRNGGHELWVADADGDNAVPITHFNGPIAGTPRWSLDGKLIAFDGRPGGNSDVFVVPSGGGAVRQLTSTPGEDARPAWSTDGRSIYFCSDRSGRPEIWRMDADGSHPARITHNGGLAVLAAPDGNGLFYKREGDGPIYRIRDDGTGDEPLTSERTYAFLPFAVTSSGLWFVSPPGAHPEWEIRVMRFADHKTTTAARFRWPADGLGISVSPDEHYVLVTKMDTNGTDLLLVSGFR
jgi:Tol biopolymer transport system component